MNYHHGLMTTDPIVIQSKPTSMLINRNNPRIKRNLKYNRRSTGIQPNDVSLASTSTEVSSTMEFIDIEG